MIFSSVWLIFLSSWRICAEMLCMGPSGTQDWDKCTPGSENRNCEFLSTLSQEIRWRAALGDPRELPCALKAALRHVPAEELGMEHL